DGDRGGRRRLEADLALPGGEGQVCLGQQLRIEQRAVQLAMRVVHPQPPAQRIERIALAREALAREQQRILHVAAVGDAAVVRACQAQLVVEEADVERRVVDDQFGAV